MQRESYRHHGNLLGIRLYLGWLHTLAFRRVLRQVMEYELVRGQYTKAL